MQGRLLVLVLWCEFCGAPAATLKNELRSKPYFHGNGSNNVLSGLSALKINEDGVWNTYYLPGAEVIDNGMTVKYTPPYRFYLMKSDTTDYSNRNNYYMPILPGKVFEVDIDYGGSVACGCNVNFYLVNGPVGFPGKDGDYYCDAQCFDNMGCCHEFDMNEGNAWVQQITNHACNWKGYYQDHPDWECNKWGDPENKITPHEFGEGSSNTIDSTRQFTFRQEYKVSGGNRVETTLIQDGKTVFKSMGPNSELDNMFGKMRQGMAFVTGYWTAGDMNWMDGDSCGQGYEQCSGQPAYIKNWRITTIGGPTPAPQPTLPTPAPPPGSDCDCSWAGNGKNCGPDDKSVCWSACCSAPGSDCDCSWANTGTCSGPGDGSHCYIKCCDSQTFLSGVDYWTAPLLPIFGAVILALHV